jgi:hypothetical protein
MPVKPISSYPYLHIAEKYGLPYGDVLMVAQFYTKDHGDRLYDEQIRISVIEPYHRIENTLAERDRLKPISNKYRFGSFMSEIADAVRNFHAIIAEGWDQS